MPATPTPSANLLQLLPEAVVQTDALWEITYLNPAWHKLTGHSVAEALGKSLLKFVHPDDIGTLRSGMPVFRLRFANADYRWVRLQFHPETDAADRVISRQGVLIEVTEVTEQVLVEVRQRFLRLLETIDGVVWEAEIGVGNTFLSPQVERLFGYSVEEWRADPGFWRAHVHPDDLAQALVIDDAAYNATHSHAYEMSYRLIAKSGKVVWVRDLCRAVVEPGRPNRMIGLMIDVTQQKKTELELLRSENRYSLATRGSNDGIWYWDLRTDALHVSGRFLQIVGLGSRDHVFEDGWRFLEQLIDREDRARVQETYRRHLSGNGPNFSVDFRAFHGAGRLVWVNWRGLAEFEDGVPVRMAGSLSDLAERGSSYDALTNLPGRPLFRDRLAQLIALHQGDGVNGDGVPTRGGATMFAVLLLDLNGFKAVNDSYGHHVGDQLLQQVARRLESCVRAVDLVARMSGDEFNVLLESIDPAEASQRAQQIALALAAPYVIGEHTVISGASIGLASSASKLATVDDYLRAADTAMYRAKSQLLGVCVFQ
ncbi:MAG: PAS domain-containing protein [Gammaproteobacteria bacterium]|nr:PAS domain-containing protein [Gammaproteobacteria bacterium]MBU1504446.1 PAS domain-containing protein [Gammaproteobacteria bacterium]MBU2118952.1 PAS domain-containing protein [Gammaproteobacteria bacterium]MBU2171375.1 PAS domain-containing protein [Gammaproteobacteria bacterium]MBU2201204.1 PAS domain-containing protein [Gammaproteobacteria bacterium]